MLKKQIYIKQFPKDIERILYGPRILDNYALFSNTGEAFTRTIFEIVPAMMIFVGMTLIGIVIFPILVYQLQYIPHTFKREIIKPIKLLENYQISAQNEENFQKEKAGAVIAQVDTTDPKNWFPEAKYSKLEKPKIVNYTISIPKLGINQANVEIGGENLKKSLIHFPGSSVPGELGNAVIFGHSTLPLFFNPKVYETIFSTLPTLKKGDEIVARVDGIEYKYVIYEMATVDPDELSVLEQKYDKYDMSVITCVPPGTKWKRLVVKARLKEI
jgi:sortase A